MNAIVDVDQLNGVVKERNMLYKALVDLFQACSKLCLEDMDKLEAEINAASAAIDKAGQP